MKYPLFECLGDDYPRNLEERHERILARIAELWNDPEIHDYFSDLLIDKRGGRQGFSPEIVQEILALRTLRESEDLSAAETPEDAAFHLETLGHAFTDESFLKAIRQGNKELVDLFVRANANLEARDATGATPLLMALKAGYTVIAHILLKAGANVNVADELRLTPLLIACGKPTMGYRTIAEALVRCGAYLDVRDRLGYTPLLLAVSGGMYEITELLLQRGADVSAVNRRGQNVVSMINAMRDLDQRSRFEALLMKYRGTAEI